MNLTTAIGLIAILSYIGIMIMVSRSTYLYAIIYYVDKTKKEFGPFKSEEDFSKWLINHEITSEVGVKAYRLEHRADNSNINLTT